MPRRHALCGVAAVTCASLFVTANASAYRTAADRDEFAGSERVRWQPARVTYEVHERGAPGLSAAAVLEAVKSGAETWMRERCSALELVSMGLTATPAKPDDGKNTIEWLETGWLERGFGTQTAGVTDTLYELGDDSQWRIIEADVYLDAEHVRWSFSTVDDGTHDVQTVLTHELGHVLGLLHPCEADGADGAPDCSSSSSFEPTTMYPFYDAEQATLDQDDVAGLCFLYPFVHCETLGCALGQVCTPEGCASTCGENGEVTCSISERCTEGRCEPRPCSICACSIDADCENGLRCLEAVCAPGSGVVGDPCEQDVDCETQACSANGFCAIRCGSDATCGDSVCGEPAPETDTRHCATQLAAFGEPCSSPSDCLGGECLQVGDATPVCTRSCVAGLPECPDNWECVNVERELVCAPPLTTSGTYATGGGGCSISPHARGSTPPRPASWTIALGIVSLMCAAARRTRRRRS